MQRMIWLRALVATGSVLALLVLGTSAQAATRSMTGSLGVVTPSVAAPFFFGGGPTILGRKVGPYAPNAGFTTISVAGTTTGTFVGRQVTVPGGKFDFTELDIRDFPAFPGVGNLTNVASSVQLAATFMNGAGALAACPGPGCTSSGSGTAISWCPPLVERTATPAPGTVANQIGNWDCASWPAGAGGGDRFLRIGIANVPGAAHFGGTFTLLRNWRQNVWRILVQPGMDGIAEVSRTWRSLNSVPWTGGFPNFQYQGEAGNPGPRLFARLNASGAVTQTLGCVNPTGTPGGSFMLGTPVIGVGSNCGTPPTPQAPLQGWGFQMTTANIEGSDPFPFGLVVTNATPPGTPFQPNFGTQPTSLGFFFTRMGGDTVSGTNRNLVLLGGGVASDPPSGNAFFRITELRLDMQVPEPALGLGIMAGVTGLLVLGRRRRS